MSPTSYQAAPPRKSNISAQLHPVKHATEPINAPKNAVTTACDQPSSRDPTYFKALNKEDRQTHCQMAYHRTSRKRLPEDAEASAKFPYRGGGWSPRSANSISQDKSCLISNAPCQKRPLPPTLESPSPACANGGRPAKPQIISVLAESSGIQRGHLMISSPRTAQTPVMKMENSKPRKRDRDGLYQRKGRGPWYFKFENPVGSGKWFARSTGTSVYNEAKQERMQFLGDIKKNRLPNERAKWTLQAAVDHYLADRRYRIKPGSYRSEACIVGSLLNILGADEKLQSLAHITPIRRYQNTRLAAGIKPKSVNNEILCLSSVLRGARLRWRWGNITKSLKVDVNDEIDALTLEEQQRLLQVARSADPNAVAPYVAVMSYSTGMRHKEIRLLQLSAIQELNTEYPIIRVRRSTTKTNAGARPVSLDSMAVWAVRKLLERAKRVGATEPNHYLLPTFLERHSRPTDPLYGKGKGFDPEHPMGS